MAFWAYPSVSILTIDTDGSLCFETPLFARSLPSAEKGASYPPITDYPTPIEKIGFGYLVAALVRYSSLRLPTLLQNLIEVPFFTYYLNSLQIRIIVRF